MKLVAIHSIQILNAKKEVEEIAPGKVFEVEAEEAARLQKIGAAAKVNSKKAEALQMLAEAEEEGDEETDETEGSEQGSTKKAQSALQNKSTDKGAPVVANNKTGAANKKNLLK